MSLRRGNNIYFISLAHHVLLLLPLAHFCCSISAVAYAADSATQTLSGLLLTDACRQNGANVVTCSYDGSLVLSHGPVWPANDPRSLILLGRSADTSLLLLQPDTPFLFTGRELTVLKATVIVAAGGVLTNGNSSGGGESSSLSSLDSSLSHARRTTSSDIRLSLMAGIQVEEGSFFSLQQCTISGASCSEYQDIVTSICETVEYGGRAQVRAC